MRFRKTLSIALCAVMLVAMSVAGTLAYLTSRDEVKNTFTVGQVSIDLWETAVDEEGRPISLVTSADPNAGNQITQTGNAYHLLPGHSYTKDPTVSVKAGSETCYVRMIVTATFSSPLTDPVLAQELDDIFVGYNDLVWDRHAKTVSTNDAGNTVITYEYRHTSPVMNSSDTDDLALDPLFTSIAVPSTWNNTQIAVANDLKVDVVAHAIQKAGFETADAAWQAFDVQHSS